MVVCAGHRDIGLGLFGESVDLGLPDYYFNALIPLEPLTPENGTELVMRKSPPCHLRFPGPGGLTVVGCVLG